MIRATNLDPIVQALIEVERGHVVYGRARGWSRMSSMVSALFARNLAEAVEPPKWMRKTGRLYQLVPTEAGRAMLPKWRETPS